MTGLLIGRVIMAKKGRKDAYRSQYQQERSKLSSGESQKFSKNLPVCTVSLMRFLLSSSDVVCCYRRSDRRSAVAGGDLKTKLSRNDVACVNRLCGFSEPNNSDKSPPI